MKFTGNVADVALSLTLIVKLFASPLVPTRLILLSVESEAVIPLAAALIAAIMPAGVSVAVLRVACATPPIVISISTELPPLSVEVPAAKTCEFVI